MRHHIRAHINTYDNSRMILRARSRIGSCCCRYSAGSSLLRISAIEKIKSLVITRACMHEMITSARLRLCMRWLCVSVYACVSW